MKKLYMMLAAWASGTLAYGQSFKETIGNVAVTPTAIATHAAANGFANNWLSFSGTADLRQTNVSSGYAQASGQGNVYLSKLSVNFTIGNINTTGIAMPALAFGMRKAGDADNGAEVIVEYSVNGGSSWTALSLPPLPTGTATAGWHYRVAGGLPQAAGLMLRFRKNASDNFYFLDDFSVNNKTVLMNDVAYQTYTYKTVDTTTLQLDVFMPPGRVSLDSLAPVMVLFHGGSWQGGNKEMLHPQCQYFAKRGMVTVTANYRFRNSSGTGMETTEEICIRDAKSAVRWVKQQAAVLGIDTTRIVLAGGSAGGHLATMTSVNQQDNNDSTDNLSVSTRANALVLFNPAYRHFTAASLLPYNYIHNEGTPAIFLYGGLDNWKPAGDMLYKAFNFHGADAEMWVADEAGHGFFNSAFWRLPCNLLADNFLTGLGLLDDEGYSFPLPVDDTLHLQAPYAFQPAPFRETFGQTTTAVTNMMQHQVTQGYDNDGLYFSGVADVRNTLTSSGYGNASGGANVFLSRPDAALRISGINTSALAAPVLAFGIYKGEDNNNGSALAVEYTTDGATWAPLSMQPLPDGAGSAGWYYRVVKGLPAAPQLSIRFRNSASAHYFFLDDVTVEDSTALAPLGIRGVKWRQAGDEEFLQTTVNWWLAKPAGSTKPGVLAAVATKANAIVLRVDRADRFKPDTTVNFNKAMDEIVDAIVKAKTNNVPLDIYLWARIWLERDGAPNYGTADAGAAAVRDWFTPVLNKALAAGVLDRIKGIALIETNCDRTQDVKDYALRIADKFNGVAAWQDATGRPFFHTRTLMVPGAAFGMDFRNIGNGGGTFFDSISAKCRNFSFIYKLMQGTHETVTGPEYDSVLVNGTYRSWANDMEENDASFSVTDRKAYLNYFGIGELTAYVNTYKESHPTAANIVFWGDKWDGISQTRPMTRQALHSLLVRNGGEEPIATNTSYFFTLAANHTSNTSAAKFYLLDTTLAPNQVPGWTGISASAEWDSWPLANRGTMPFSETGGTVPGSLTTVQINGLFDSKALLLNFGGTADLRNTTPSTGYPLASGGNAFFLKKPGAYLQINELNTALLPQASVAFGVYKDDSTATGSDLKVEYSTDGNTWSPASFSALPAGGGTAGWYYRVADGLPLVTALHLRFVKDSSANFYLVDDILIHDTDSVSEGPLMAPGMLSAIKHPGQAHSAAVTLYPNPVHDELYVTYPSTDAEVILTVGGMDGKLHYRNKLLPNSTSCKVSLAGLPPGIYWLSIQGKGAPVVRKVVKY
ncbi:carboxylesterase family protein [Chitinophaga sp.]|uniref:carboxylesterase family protein n=1 Tax=Chitinophaga sp. TaxID=1869181 RepID=UPI0031D19A26